MPVSALLIISIVLPVLTLLIYIILSCTITVIHHNHLAIRLNFGKYDKLLNSGVHCVIWPYKLLKVRNCKTNEPSPFISLKN